MLFRSGTALINRPEDVFGYVYVRAKYALSARENADEISARAAKALKEFSEKERAKILSPAI